MAQDRIAYLLATLRQLGLVSRTRLAALEAESGSASAGSEEFLGRLVQEQVLTPYQAERLRVGHGEECVLAGRYHLLDRIGSGAMAVVFRGRDTKLNRAVAIKVLSVHRLQDSDSMARFQREARALAQVSHPGIVQIHDAGEDHGRPFLVMEHVEGTSLSRMLKEQGPLDPQVAASCAWQAARALQHAHERGLIHRDLKPSNLLRMPSGQVKILDLGLARFLELPPGETEQTREGVPLGTPNYCAPEQFRNARRADARADIYSLGCTLFHLIAGEVPFPCATPHLKRIAHEEQEPPRLQEVAPGVPAGLSEVVSRMMAKRPEDRYPTAGAAAEALAPFAGPLVQSFMAPPTVAPAPEPAPPARSPSRRKSILVVAAALLVLLLAALAWWAMGPHH